MGNDLWRGATGWNCPLRTKPVGSHMKYDSLDFEWNQRCVPSNQHGLSTRRLCGRWQRRAVLVILSFWGSSPFLVRESFERTQVDNGWSKGSQPLARWIRLGETRATARESSACSCYFRTFCPPSGRGVRYVFFFFITNVPTVKRLIKYWYCYY